MSLASWCLQLGGAPHKGWNKAQSRRCLDAWSPQGLTAESLGTPEWRQCAPRPEPYHGPLTDVVDGAGTELPVELLGSQAPQVVDGVRPEVQHVVPGEGVPLLYHNHFGSQVGKFDGSAQAAGSSAHNETLRRERTETLGNLYTH